MTPITQLNSRGVAISAAIEHLEHVRKYQKHHGVRGPAMQVAQKQSRGDDELQVFRVGVGLRHRRMVIEHQRNAGRDQDQKRSRASACPDTTSR